MTGRRIGWYFVAFFGFIIAVNTLMMTLAIRTHSGVVTEHPYEKGLAYNKLLEAEKKQEALGWESEIKYKNGVLSFELLNKDNQPLSWDTATATITRPTQQGMDFTIDLEGKKTHVSFPRNGLWEVRVDAKHEGAHYQQRKRIVVE